MKLTLRTLLLIVDGLALVGLIAFSVLAALKPRQDGYLIAQIVSIGVVLICALMLQRSRRRAP